MENDNIPHGIKKMVEELIVTFCCISPYKAQITSEAIFNLLSEQTDIIRLTQKSIAQEPIEHNCSE